MLTGSIYSSLKNKGERLLSGGCLHGTTVMAIYYIEFFFSLLKIFYFCLINEIARIITHSILLVWISHTTEGNEPGHMPLSLLQHTMIPVQYIQTMSKKESV